MLSVGVKGEAGACVGRKSLQTAERRCYFNPVCQLPVSCRLVTVAPLCATHELTDLQFAGSVWLAPAHCVLFLYVSTSMYSFHCIYTPL